jgi:REP element-mobilizing transposase RayT
MSDTYSSLHYHFVFGTKNRAPLLADAWRERLCQYIGGIVRSEGGVLERIGGMADHLHLLVSWKQSEALSDLMRAIKANSSRWIHDTLPEMKGFAWQDGYAVFSVSKSQCEAVARYIETQSEHHKKWSFQEELKALLDKHGVEYNPEYSGESRG